MKHDLKKPCKNCPFRNDVRPYLRKARVVEITDSILRQQQDFPCHKTISLNDDDSGTYFDGRHDKAQMCAGAMILAEKMNAPTQMMRISERLGMYDHTKLDMDSPVFDTPQEFIQAQEK